MTGTVDKRISKGLMAAMVLALTGACFADTEYNAERYDVILDRSPFGVDPLAGVEDTSAQDMAAASAAAALAKDMRLCFVMESQSGEIRAGLQNQKDQKSFILSVGESIQGIKLLGVNIQNSEATLERNGQKVLFKLDKAPVVSVAPAAPAPADRRFGGGFRRTPQPAPPQAPPEPELSPEEQARRRDEIRANLQNYQMEVIRSGMPPLPIPLTQEMDDQLVSEGILPPE